MKQLWLVLVVLFLSACGSDSGGGASAPKSAPQVIDRAPSDIIDQGFDLTIQTIDLNEGAESSVKVGESLVYRFGGAGKFVLEDYGQSIWQFSGDYTYQANGDSGADIGLSLDTGQQQQLALVFNTSDSGTWRLESDDGVISGSFFYSVISPVVEYSYRGSIEAKQSINSALTHYSYPYQIYLPEGYDPMALDTYPVIYATDGQWVFWDFSKVIDERGLPVILVAIDQGPSLAVNRRMIDYTLPGSSDYIDFFKSEFMPLIEVQYRVDASLRSIQGASLGGLVVSHFLMAEDRLAPSFHNFFSADGSYWLNSSGYGELEGSAGSDAFAVPVNLHLTGATLQGNAEVVRNYLARIEALNIGNLQVYHESYSITHVESALPSFESALDLYF